MVSLIFLRDFIYNDFAIYFYLRSYIKFIMIDNEEKT